MSLTLTINGQPKDFGNLVPPANLAQVIERMDLKADRVAVEHNGVIAPRTNWAQIEVNAGDRLEVVHFVGGGGWTEGRNPAV